LFSPRTKSKSLKDYLDYEPREVTCAIINQIITISSILYLLINMFVAA